MLPLDFPKWQLVYYYYRKWASLSDFDLLLDKLRGHVRVKRGQNMEPSVGIIDSQSVRWGTMPPETANCRMGMCYFVKNVMKFLRELLHALFFVLELMANPCNNRKIILSVQGFAN